MKLMPQETSDLLWRRDTTAGGPAQSPARWRFWGTIGWGLGIYLAYLLVDALTVYWRAVAAAPGPGSPTLQERLAAAIGNGTTIALSSIAASGAGCLLLLAVIAFKKRSNVTDYLALRSVALRTVLVWSAVLMVYVLLSDSATLLGGRPLVPEYVSHAYATAHPKWLLLLALVTLVPLFEEALFRGFLFAGFASTYLRPGGAIVVTSVLWAALHVQYGVFEIITIFGLGLVLGASRIMTNSLAVPVLLHATANAIATAETLLTR